MRRHKSHFFQTIISSVLIAGDKTCCKAGSVSTTRLVAWLGIERAQASQQRGTHSCSLMELSAAEMGSGGLFKAPLKNNSASSTIMKANTDNHSYNYLIFAIFFNSFNLQVNPMGSAFQLVQFLQL